MPNGYRSPDGRIPNISSRWFTTEHDPSGNRSSRKHRLSSTDRSLHAHVTSGNWTEPLDRPLYLDTPHG